MAWGLGCFGQPHILAHFMALRSSNDVPAARLINMVWMVFALFNAVFVGYAGIAYFTAQSLENSETVFIQFCRVLFKPWARSRRAASSRTSTAPSRASAPALSRSLRRRRIEA